MGFNPGDENRSHRQRKPNDRVRRELRSSLCRCRRDAWNLVLVETGNDWSDVDPDRYTRLMERSDCLEPVGRTRCARLQNAG